MSRFMPNRSRRKPAIPSTIGQDLQKSGSRCALQGLKSAACSFDRLLNIRRRVRGTEECSFKLRRREIDSAVEHAAMELRKRRDVRLGSVLVLENRFTTEKPGEH